MTADPLASLALLRRQVAALLSEIDTATLPRPDKFNGRATKKPGQEWNPGKGWSVFTVEDGECAGMDYLDHACDDIDYRWGEPGDWESMRIEDARAIGLALLAAANRAEELFVGVSRLPTTDPAGSPETGETAPIRELRRRRR